MTTAARQGSDSLLPYLTARADPIFDADQCLVQGWLATRYPQQDAQTLEMATDVIVRMTISHLILPVGEQHLIARRLATAALKLLRCADPHAVETWPQYGCSCSRRGQRRPCGSNGRSPPVRVVGHQGAPMTSPSMVCFCVMGVSSSTTGQ
ncbi:hypothetical protein [Streptomyces microflavus]|uniref:hypothetical protein n=1 Tax=Streptomyces microflavus TaxID=1919 RepID=UPI003666E21D